MKQLLTMASVAGVVLVLVSSQAFANTDEIAAWFADYPDPCQRLVDAANNCTLCHTSVPALNPYGDAMDPADPGAIGGDDSDGDGRTNDEEINIDCTLPGDGDDVPLDESTWARIKDYYR